MPGESQMPPETRPDPTVLTTEALERGLEAERDWTKGQLDVVLERLRGIDRATSLLNETVNRTPTEIQKEIAHLRERTDLQTEASKEAIAAALAAQKEAVSKQDTANQKAIDKTESRFEESLKTLRALFDSEIKSLGEKVSDLQRAQERGEGSTEGVDRRDGKVFAVIAATGVILTIVILLSNLFIQAGVGP